MPANTITTVALVIPNAVTNAIRPKPTKSELIEALAQKKYNQLLKEHKELAESLSRLEKEAEEAVRAWVLANSKAALVSMSFGLGRYNRKDWNDKTSEKILTHVCLQADLDNLPASVQKKLISYHTARETTKSLPDFNDVKRDIRDAVNEQVSGKGERVDAMLADPKVSKALDQMLKALDGEPVT